MSKLMPSLGEFGNAGEIQSRIALASERATAMYRASGRRLNAGATDVPVADEIQAILEFLVEEAIGGFLATSEVAPGNVERSEITGEAIGPGFEVYVSGRGDKDLNIEIFARLA